MKNGYQTPAFWMVGLAEEDILTLSTLDSANDAEVDKLDYIKNIRW